VIRDGHGDRTRERRPDDILHTGGVTASRGFGTGTAFIAQSPGDAGHFPKGAVLVAAQPLPFWATLLRNASALVIEQGGVACHLANVAREFDVPALFGVEGARQKLPEGGVISVDANHRKIYRGAIEDPLADAIVPRSSNTSSEVFDTLKKVAKLIVPLNLVDSEDPHFRAERCETFHDITRFCHEKSVEEMFGFGAEHHFPARASRRLFKEVPTQFWIVDLGDGLREPATDPRFVRFDNIASIPMLAVWRGMDAFEWDGPPPVDPKGFFQLLASSAMDRHLNISVPSRYASGNHFMISRNYCSLQTRFGYHFATVEALVGDSAMENYVRLLFSGGGAGQARKNRRARLIAEVLEHKGFQTTRSRDTVEARLGGYGQPRMEAALEVLGYLLVHTRQLDMVMKDNMSFDRYKSKILTDLDNL
jgi:pyruvate,water dikinase